MRLRRVIALLWCLGVVCGFGGEVSAPEYGSYVKLGMPPKPVARPAPKLNWSAATVSYYGKGFHGRKMANGERFNAYGHNGVPTVAHRSLPIDTLVEFKNPQNGRKIITRVADRGPYVKGRQFDLNEWTAVRLGIKQQGVARLQYAIVGKLAKRKGQKHSTPNHQQRPHVGVASRGNSRQ